MLLVRKQKGMIQSSWASLPSPANGSSTEGQWDVPLWGEGSRGKFQEWANLNFRLEDFLSNDCWSLSVAIYADWVLTLAMNIWLPLFWSAWSILLGVGPRARTKPHLQTWCMSVIIAFVQSRSKSDRHGLAIVFPFQWTIEKTWKTVAHAEGVFNPQPLRLGKARENPVFRS